MPTRNPRINITLEESTVKFLNKLAKQENTSVSSIARELVLEALERREDIALSALAEIRDVKHTKKVKHDDAWK